MHECKRVFVDRLYPEDYEFYDEVFKKVTELAEFDQTELYGEPDADGNPATMIFTSFISHQLNGEHSYLPAENMDQVTKALDVKMEEYAGVYPAMNIVLFRQAVEHITRISRIVQKNCGNALLLGVGGSGKQSLSKLAVFLHETIWYQILIKGTYNYMSFKEDIRMLFEKSAVKPAKP